MLGEYNNTATERKRIYLNVKDGALVRKVDNGEQRYSFVSGSVENIYTKQRVFRGETVTYWYVDMRDPGGELYCLGFSYRSNVFKSLILCLASATDLSNIKIEAYSKNGYDKVAVYEGSSRLDWAVKELPAVEVVTVGGQQVKDDSKRMKLIRDLVEKIGKLFTK